MRGVPAPERGARGGPELCRTARSPYKGTSTALCRPGRAVWCGEETPSPPSGPGSSGAEGGRTCHTSPSPNFAAGWLLGFFRVGHLHFLSGHDAARVAGANAGRGAELHVCLLRACNPAAGRGRGPCPPRAPRHPLTDTRTVTHADAVHEISPKISSGNPESWSVREVCDGRSALPASRPKQQGNVELASSEGLVSVQRPLGSKRVEFVAARCGRSCRFSQIQEREFNLPKCHMLADGFFPHGLGLQIETALFCRYE